jgi:TPR repeat protein
MICEFGRYGVPKSQEEAVKYYRMASDQGSPHGMMCFADMLEHGKGVPVDHTEAIRLYRLAAAKNHSKALGCIGFKMITGDGVPKDIEKGKELIRRQVELGDPVGLLHLGRIAEEGVGGPVDLDAAYRYYAMAAGSGLSPGLLRMSRMMMLGQGTRQCPLGALDMYTMLIERDGNTDAMASLGLHYLQGEGVAKDPKRGSELIRRAASHGNRKAQHMIGLLKCVSV